MGYAEAGAVLAKRAIKAGIAQVVADKKGQKKGMRATCVFFRRAFDCRARTCAHSENDYSR